MKSQNHKKINNSIQELSPLLKSDFNSRSIQNKFNPELKCNKSIFFTK